MSKSNLIRRFFGGVAVPVLMAWAGSVLAQAPASLPNPVVNAPQFQPTPEQVGDALMTHQRYQAAIESYKKSASRTAESWNKMGVAYQLMFNIDEAGRCYQAALKLEPKNPVAFNNMGSIYMAKKDYAKAERFYHKALKLDPRSALFHKNLGTALLADRKYAKGWESYQEALAIDPRIFDHSGNVRVESPSSIQDRGAMNFYLAKSCVKAGMKVKAVEYLRMALNEGFTNPKKILADAELASLRDVPAFQELLASQGVYLTAPGAPSSVPQ